MRKNAFADALAADLDDDLGSEATLTMNGETPSLDASDAHSVGDSDDLSDEAETEASQAVTQANNKAASATKGKRKLSSRKASGSQPSLGKKFRREINHAALMKMNILDQANGADIKCLFIPGKKAKDGQHAIPLLPQFDAQWRDADFGKRTWLVISTQSRWVQLLMKTQLRNNPTAADSRTACAHLCASVKLEFDACLDKQRCRLRARPHWAAELINEEPLGLPPNWAAECVAELAAGRRRMAEACTAIGLTPPVQPPDTNIHRMYSAEYCRNIRQEWCAANCQEGESSCGSVGNVDQKPYFPSSLPLDHPDCHWNRVAPWNGDDDDCHWNGVATEMVLLRGCTTPQW
jgi:hypothetical protein